MIINHLPLSWYIEKLTKSTPYLTHFSIIKHSDASLYCMQGREGGDCNGCDYTPELREGLLASLSKHSHGFYHGVQRLTDRDYEGFDKLCLDYSMFPSWHDTGIVAASFIDGKLFPLIKAIRSLDDRVIIVSNAKAREIERIIPYDHFIETPPSNTYNERERIIREIIAYGEGTYFFSCGMAACAIIPVLHGRVRNTRYVDIGHIWDPFLGIKSRHYMTGMTQDHIDRNLRP